MAKQVKMVTKIKMTQSYDKPVMSISRDKSIVTML